MIEKLAATADGKLADRWRNSKWISSEQSRTLVHKLRSQVQAVMVGIGTVLQDDPKLTARTPGAIHQPRPLIVDEKLQIPLSAKVLKTPAQGGAIIACASRAPKKKQDQLKRLGATVIATRPDKNNQVDLKELMKKLGAMNIASLLVEGGSHLAGAMLEQGLVDEVMYFYAPAIAGGCKGPAHLSGSVPRKITHTIALIDPVIKKSGPDFVLNAYSCGRFKCSQD